MEQRPLNMSGVDLSTYPPTYLPAYLQEMEQEMKPENLNKAKKFVYKWGLAFIALMLILWPLLSLPAGR